MKFINLTPHDVTVVLADTDTETNRRRVYSKSGTIARVAQTISTVEIVDGIDISTVKFGQVTGLPDAVDNVRYIVSAIVKNASPNRIDLVSPGELVRDENGVIIGCKGFFI
jgi:hypothetical protein